MVNFFEFDYHRSERTGINEVIFALDKSTNEIRKIIKESGKKFKAFENWKWDLI